MATTNLYHRRLVAANATKPCWVCFKQSATVLVTEDGHSDYFYICPGHLTDPKFAVAKDAEDLTKRQRDAEIEREIEAVKKEFEEKARKKTDRKRRKEQGKSGEKPVGDNNNDEADDVRDEKEKEEKLRALEKKKEPEKAKMDGPRIFELNKSFWQMRLQQKRTQEQARRNRERLRSPTAFPSVPSGDLP